MTDLEAFKIAIMKLLKIFLPLAVGCLSIASCTNVAPLDFDDKAQEELLTKRDQLKWAEEKKEHEKNQADSAAIAEKNKENRAKYLADLLEYKKSDHHLMFGWFNNWNPSSPDKEFSLDMLPDSVDWVSNWGSAWNLNDAKKAQLARAHERGIRMTIGWIIENVGSGIVAPEGGWTQYKTADGKVDVNKAIDVYVMALCDSIQKYDYDGMDVDYEPQFASPFKPGNHCGDWNANDLVDHIALISCQQYGNKDRENYFFTRMREELDKRSKEMGKPLMFNINGSLTWIDNKVVKSFDYFIAQSYGNTPRNWIDALNRYRREGVDPVKQLLVTETFQNNESNAKNFDRYARYIKNNGSPIAAGIGAFHINEDWRYGPEYANVRRVIQLMNPTLQPE